MCFLALRSRSLPCTRPETVTQTSKTAAWLPNVVCAVFHEGALILRLRKRLVRGLALGGQLFLITALLSGCLRQPHLTLLWCLCTDPPPFPLRPPCVPPCPRPPEPHRWNRAIRHMARTRRCLQGTTSHLTFTSHHSGLV